MMYPEILSRRGGLRLAFAGLAVWLALPLPLAAQHARVLRLGTLDGPPEYSFGRIGGLALFPDGRLLVLDQLAYELRAYGRDGEHLLSFGSRGEGPGEFILPTLPAVSADEVMVYDQRLRRLSRFTHAGEHLETRSFASDLTGFARVAPLRFEQWIGLEGELARSDAWSLARGTVEPGSFGRRGLLFVSGSRVDTIARVRTGSVWWHSNDGSFGPLSARLPSEELWTVAGDSLVVTVDAVVGDVRWFEVQSGRLVLRAERHLSLRPVAADLASLVPDEIPGVGRRSDVRLFGPAHVPHFDQVLVAPEGAVWLRRYLPRPRQDDADRYVVLDQGSGTPRELTLPPGFRLGVIGRERLWGIARDEFDVMYVEAYARW